MRALLIGVGGAGCRIVDVLDQHDERSGVRSVQSFVFDADQKTISEMRTISQEDRFILTPIDPAKEHNNRGTDFEVGNLTNCFQRDGIEEIDAVFVCAGLGGRMAELVPTIVSQLNNTFSDPIFTILTLPGKNEGVKVSARASKTLEDVREVSQATILFDNETWFKRIEEENDIKNVMETKHKATIYEMFPILNEMLARRVGLLLRAGEFGHKGVEVAEVVLDAGEVLNTLKETGLVAIGYAIEKLPTTWTNSMMKRIRVEKYLFGENQARTSRIVELAKQAVYREVSVPCDLTSSEKALVLIAGPSDELSMKGFQTVRKWIDRSIKGLEMRAGDYPVKSTQYVGVIIVLAGLENVPRVRELDEIRTIYYNEQNRKYDIEEEEKIKKNPTIQIANDEILFENEMVMPIGIINHPVMMKTEDDIFELDDSSKQANENEIFQKNSQIMQSPSYPLDDACEEDETMFAAQIQSRYIRSPIPANDEDVLEDVVKKMISPSTHQQQIQQPRTTTTFDNLQSENQPLISNEKLKSKEMPKISIVCSKKQRHMSNNTNTIMMLKRQKKIDNVLSGMVDVGNKDKPKDSNSVFSGKTIGGGNNRPKETMTDTCIKISGIQRPKEIDESAKILDVQKPREVNKSIRVTTIPLPKNATIREIAKKSENDK
ncbi:MAG: tubulin/FtsZ family protein [Methanocalculaceae archaeon]|jgi:cell division GTPase FtsZ|nr:tubulin/FtsZ family protein [Methanocalculaceae archaeon]